MKYIAIVFVWLGLAAAAQAEITIKDAYAYPPIGQSKVGIAYMVIENQGSEDLQVTSAVSKAVGYVELHDHMMDNGTMRMRRVESIALPAGEAVALEPGGLHIMLIDVKAPMEVGEMLDLTLTFDNNETLETAIPIKAR